MAFLIPLLSLIGIFTGLIFDYWDVTNTTPAVIHILKSWQGLLGSFIGAATPLSLYLLKEKYEEGKKRREFLFLIEKNLVSAINNLASIDTMLHRFLDDQLSRYKEGIAESEKNGIYCVGQAFVPLSAAHVIDKDLLHNNSTGSNYLENLLLDVVSNSQEIPLLLQDISRQFDRALTLNTQLGILKLNSASAHNAALLENIAIFEEFLNRQIFGINIPIYLRKLMSALVALRAMQRWGIKKWKQTFNFPPSPTSQEKIESYFKKDTDEQIELQRPFFKSKLYLIGEEMRWQ